MIDRTEMLEVPDDYQEKIGAAIWQPRMPLAAGPEMAALKPFHSDCTWTGYVSAEGMGPGSPRMEANGKATFMQIMGGVWFVGEFEQDQFVNGELVIRWMMHYVVGWNPEAGEYKIILVDNNGTAALMRGHIDGDRFVVESAGEGPVRLRLTWELGDNGYIKWRNESSINGGPWFLIEEYVCVPVTVRSP